MRDPGVVPITVFVGVADVMRAIGCSRSQAYVYLREAAGRKRGQQGLLRVPVLVWERYASGRFSALPKESLDPPRIRSKRSGRPAARTEFDAAVIPITRPRTTPQR
jgi:hypothetical protein